MKQAGFWDGKKVLITGGAGFIGSHLAEELLRRGRNVRITVADNLSKNRRKNIAAIRKDIRVVKTELDSFEEARKICRGQDIVLNLAARVGGVGYNSKHHGTMFRENMLISCHMLEAARLAEVERFLAVSSACVYPRFCTIPTPETEGFRDSPEQTNEGYGWAKRMAEFMADAYHKQFGMTIAIARPYNAYGPRDNFDLEKSHVISALIRRIVDGKENPVTVWGDGTQTRAFLFVEDFARGLLEVCEKYAVSDPLNLGADEEVTVRALAEMISKISGSKAKLQFDPSKPTGQPRRNCDTAKAQAKIGFTARVGLEEGLTRTIQWYREHYSAGKTS